MAAKTVITCDKCAATIEVLGRDGQPPAGWGQLQGQLLITAAPAMSISKDVCPTCAEALNVGINGMFPS